MPVDIEETTLDFPLGLSRPCYNQFVGVLTVNSNFTTGVPHVLQAQSIGFENSLELPISPVFTLMSHRVTFNQRLCLPTFVSRRLIVL
jgi:hypothetical protein